MGHSPVGRVLHAGGTSTMSASNAPTPDACPECRATVSESDVLIEYEANGGREVFAECPGCGEVVSPV